MAERYAYDPLGLDTGSLAGAVRGAIYGGALGAALGTLFPQVCFVAGTEVVTGAEYRDDEGNLRQVTAQRLRQMGKQRRLDVLEAVRLNVVLYMTCAIEMLKAGESVHTRDEHDPEGTFWSQ